VAADLNGDGKTDLATANHDSGTVSVLLNDGSGAFAAGIDYTTGLNPISVAAVDVNSDSKIDLVVANILGQSVGVLFNTTTDGSVAGVVRHQPPRRRKKLTSSSSSIHCLSNW
jgi:FG-GAP-like repeat